MENSLSNALAESLTENSVDTLSEILEVGIDTFLEDGVAKDIPLLSTVVGVYKIGKNINDLYLLKKLKIFVCALNDGIASEEDIQKYKKKLQDNPKMRQQELEYIMVLINRYITFEKPEMIAKLYMAYLDERITWNELTIMSEMIDRFLPGDYLMLKSDGTYCTYKNDNADSILRLNGLGLIIKDPNINQNLVQHELFIQRGMATMPDDKERIENTYKKTPLGNKLVSIIG